MHKKLRQREQTKTMLYYVAIHKSEGLDHSEGQDCKKHSIKIKAVYFLSLLFLH